MGPGDRPRVSIEGVLLDSFERMVRRSKDSMTDESRGEFPGDNPGRVERDRQFPQISRAYSCVFGVRSEPARKFALGCAQLLAEPRAAIERIIDDQLENLEPVETLLAA
jgi:hypothetical protein